MILFHLSILLMNACSTPRYEYLVYVGTYTGSGSDGIYAYHFNPANGELNPVGLVAKTNNPSYITIDPDGRFLYAVNETDSFQHEPTGAVSVFAIERKSAALTLLQQVSSLGAAPAHLSLDNSARYLMVANYNGGNAALFPVKNDGRLGTHTAFVQNAGAGVNPDRQTGPHAHFIHATNDNKVVMIADLGIDKVLIYLFDTITGSLRSAGPGFVKLDQGSGPRQIAFHPYGRFIYVLNELTSTITSFSYNPETGIMQPAKTISTLPKDFSGTNTAARILIDANGRFLYVSNRGDNSIGLFRIHSGDGILLPIEWFSTGGNTPRHFDIDPTGQWLFAANQDSDNIVLFRIEKVTGRLIQTSRSLDLDSPVCLSFLIVK
jgi:6-phosphogluconolactonase